MNKNLYRLVFSKKFGALVAVSEITVAQGRSASGDAAHSATAGMRSTPYELGALSIAVAMAFAIGATVVGVAPYAYAQSVLPTGGVITKGLGTIATTGNTLTINQGSNVLSTNWNSFSIGASNSVVFNQPSSNSIAINRVIGNSQSEIYGNLQANGQVFLINPNGVLFGKGSQVQVGSLFATTKDITDAQIDAGDYKFAGLSTAGIVNQGVLTATGGDQGAGFIVLHADRITNEGKIVANGGQITLAAGQSMGLTLDNGQLLSVQVTNAVANALVQNKGLIVADGGQVFLTAKGRDSLLNTVINNEGVIQAKSFGMKNGQIVLDGSSEGGGGDVLSSGSLDVSGGAGQKGGAVIVTGDRVALLSGSSINASGDAGGGRIIVGGDSLGKVADVASVQFANQAVVQAGASIDVSSKNGVGGFIETSGHSLTN
jgi:filamentous hemagglutinin family protein